MRYSSPRRGPLELAHVRAWGWSSLLAGGLLFMGLYHLVLHYWRNKDASTLYFGFYCLMLAVHFSTSDATEWVVYLLFPKANSMFVERFSIVCYVCSASMVYRFYRALYPKEFPHFVMYFCDIRSIAFVLAAMLLSEVFLFETLYYFMFSSFLLIASYITSLSLCLKRGHYRGFVSLCWISCHWTGGDK